MPPRRPGPANVMHFAAATGGWNSIDNIAAMEPTDAVQLINWFPETSYLRLRKGSRLWSQTAATGAVRTLMTYSNVSGQKLLAASGGAIYNVTASGSAPSIASGFGSDVWQHVNFATPGGQFLVAVNGVNGPLYEYDGATWAAAAITWNAGVPASNFSSVAVHASRLFFTGDQNLWLYWLPVTVKQGQVNGMDLGGFLPKGGAIACIGTWTRDNATAGMNTLLVVVTTRGEAIVFSGIDPEDAASWQMVGRFELGEPVSGHRQLCWLGPDLMLICEDGFQALANYLAQGQSKALASAVNRKIGNAVTHATKFNKLSPGWEACLYPANNMLAVNVPTSGGFEQYVVNTLTGAWARFTGIDAWTWAVFQNGIYFGNSTGAVIQAETGPDDLGKPILFDMVTAFLTPGNAPQIKRATMCQPYIISNGLVKPYLDVNVDYNISTVSGLIDTVASTAEWDTVDWNEFDWGSSGYVQSAWYSVGGIGQAFAVRLTGSAVATDLRLMALDLAVEGGINFI